MSLGFKRLKTFQQKVLVLPVVAAVFLVAILLVSMVLGYSTSRVHTRIGLGHAPALERSHQLEVEFASLHRAVEQLATGRPSEQLEVVRTQARALKSALESPGDTHAPRDASRAQQQKDAFVAWWTRAEQAAQLGTQGQLPQAAAELVLAQAPASTLRELLGEATLHQREAMQDAFAEVTRLHELSQGMLVVLVVLCIGALAALSLRLAREVVGPLAQLTAATRRIALEGDLTQTLEVHSDDEVGQLTRSIQELVQKLRGVPLSLKKVAEELGAAAAKLTDANMEQINFLTQQSRSLTEAGTTMAEIAQTSDVAATRAEMVMRVAAQADAFSHSGQESIEQSAQGLQLIRERVGALVTNISQLSAQALHAGEITGTVKDLADQSNVLALNAAIEAARAGEQGRGFAVVAREMRALSAQSLQSTQRIGKILTEINQAIRQTVASAEGDSGKMEENIEKVLASASSLKDITTVVQESAQAARQIVASVTQQNAGIAQMTEVISQLSQMMGDVGSATMMAQEAVTQLNDSVGELQRVVSGFRL